MKLLFRSKGLVRELLKEDVVKEFLCDDLRRHDEGTYHHSIRVAENSVYLGLVNSRSDKDLRTLGLGGLLHDIGKVLIPNYMLNRKIDKHTLAYIKLHPRVGFGLLIDYPLLEGVRAIVGGHHMIKAEEPYGRPPEGQHRPLVEIVAVADAFDAINDLQRGYVEPLEPAQIRKKLESEFPKLGNYIDQIMSKP